MALKVELKPFERIVIGESVLTNSDTRTTFLIAGDAPILREKDILMPEDADTPLKRIYLCIQSMYLEKNMGKYQDQYLDLMQELLLAEPRFREPLQAASKLILSGSLYPALKGIRKLMKREEGAVEVKNV
jgi:flagellar protein FlbT